MEGERKDKEKKKTKKKTTEEEEGLQVESGVRFVVVNETAGQLVGGIILMPCTATQFFLKKERRVTRWKP